MSDGKLRVERDGPIGRMVLDNPARRNAINAAMWQAIPEAVAGFKAVPQMLRDEDPHIIVREAPVFGDKFGLRLNGVYYNDDGHYINTVSGSQVGGSEGS